MITLSRCGSGGKVHILGLHYYIPLYYIIICPEMYSWGSLRSQAAFYLTREVPPAAAPTLLDT